MKILDSIKGPETTEKKPNQNPKIKAVMFVPYTPFSELAKRLRQAEEKLEEITGFRLKIVERAGLKMEDVLHSSNPWRGEDCGRPGCLLCKTKQITGKQKTQCCRKRSLVYEVWCIECSERMEKEIEKMDLSEEEKKRKIENIKQFKYIGETKPAVVSMRGCKNISRE